MTCIWFCIATVARVDTPLIFTWMWGKVGGIWSWLQSDHPVISYSQTAVALFCIYTLCAVFCLPKSIVLLVVFVCCVFANVDRTIIFQPWRLLICKTWSFRLYYVIVCKWSTVRVLRDVGASCVYPPSSSIWPHLSYGLVRSKREYYHICSLVVFLCSFL